MKKRGRPTKLTPAVQKRIMGLLRLGLSHISVCNQIGVDQETFQGWTRRHPEFLLATLQAEGAGEIKALRKIQNASDWKGSAWYLERRHPDNWALEPKLRQLADQKVEATLKLLQSHLSPENYEQVLVAFGLVRDLAPGGG